MQIVTEWKAFTTRFALSEAKKDREEAAREVGRMRTRFGNTLLHDLTVFEFRLINDYLNQLDRYAERVKAFKTFDKVFGKKCEFCWESFEQDHFCWHHSENDCTCKKCKALSA